MTSQIADEFLLGHAEKAVSTKILVFALSQVLSRISWNVMRTIK